MAGTNVAPETDSPIAEPVSADLPSARAAARTAARPGPLVGIHPILFGIYPVLFLWSQNVGEVAPYDIGDAFWLTLFGALVTTAVVAAVFRDRRRGALVVAPILLGALVYGHIAELGVRSDIQNFAWLAIVIAAMVGAVKLSRHWLARLDTALLRIATILVVVSLVTIVPTEVEEALTPDPVVAAGRILPGATTAPTRDVYWIVLDRYGSDRSFEAEYGVSNPFTPWLRERGFEVLDDSHANYVATALSMSTTLNMTPLDELASEVPTGSRSYAPTYSALQGSLVVRQFQALGYRYLHLGSWWNPTRTDAAADRNYNADGVSDFTSVLVETSVWPVALEAFGETEEPVPSESAKHLKHNTYALDQLERIRGESGPKFVLAHILLPHPPYVFDRDGRYIPPEEQATLDEHDLWHRQLDYTNSRLQRFLEPLLALPEDRRPIIILQADEGPWPARYGKDKYEFDWNEATADELEAKFGILNAWYVPGDTDLRLRPSQTAINTFPILFEQYFGIDDYPELPDRVSASGGWNRPYQLIDVTDRLPSLRGG